jgi:hypothetical protein
VASSSEGKPYLEEEVRNTDEKLQLSFCAAQCV